MSFEGVDCVRQMCDGIFYRTGIKTIQDAASITMNAAWEVYMKTRSITNKITISDIAVTVRKYISAYLLKEVAPRFSSFLSNSQEGVVELYEEQWLDFVASVALLKVIFLSCDASWTEFHGAGIGVSSNSLLPAECRSVELIALTEWKNLFFNIEIHLSPPSTVAQFTSSFVPRFSDEIVRILDRHRELCNSGNRPVDIYGVYDDSHATSSSSAHAISEGSILAKEEIKLSIPSVLTSSFPNGETNSKIRKQFDTLTRISNALMMLPDFHPSPFFLDNYVKRMLIWYEKKCSDFAKNTNVVQYIREMKLLLKEETARSAILFQNGEAVLATLPDMMLKYSPEPLTEEMLFKWMREVGEERGFSEELSGFFMFLNIRDYDGDFMRKVFCKYAIREMKNFLQKCKSLGFPGSSEESLTLSEECCDAVLHQLVLLLRHLETIVRDGFLEHACMQGAIDEAFECASREWSGTNIRKLSERLAVMTHFLIRHVGTDYSVPNFALPLSLQNSNLSFTTNEKTVLETNGTSESRVARKDKEGTIRKRFPTLEILDTLRLFYFFVSLRKCEQNCFFKEHQLLLAKRLLIFVENDGDKVEESEQNSLSVALSSLEKQRRAETYLLSGFSSIITDPIVFNCFSMLSSTCPVDYLTVDEYDIPFTINSPSSVSLRFTIPSQIRVKSRVIAKEIWGIANEDGALDVDALHASRLASIAPVVGFLHTETQKNCDRLAKRLAGCRLCFSVRYSTCLVRLKAPSSSVVMKDDKKTQNLAPRLVHSSPISTVLVRLTVVQMWIVLCFNNQYSWKETELKELLGIEHSEILMEEFASGLQALCDNKILRRVRNDDGSHIALENVEETIFSPLREPFQEHTTHSAVQHSPLSTSFSGRAGEVNETDACIKMSAIPDITITRNLEGHLRGTPSETEKTDRRTEGTKRITVVSEDKKVHPEKEKEWGEALSVIPQKDSDWQKKLRTCPQDVLHGQVIRLIKEKGPILLRDLFATFTNKTATILRNYAPVSKAQIKVAAELLIERKYLRRKNNMLYYVP